MQVGVKPVAASVVQQGLVFSSLSYMPTIDDKINDLFAITIEQLEAILEDIRNNGYRKFEQSETPPAGYQLTIEERARGKRAVLFRLEAMGQRAASEAIKMPPLGDKCGMCHSTKPHKDFIDLAIEGVRILESNEGAALVVSTKEATEYEDEGRIRHIGHTLDLAVSIQARMVFAAIEVIRRSPLGYSRHEIVSNIGLGPEKAGLGQSYQHPHCHIKLATGPGKPV